MRAADVGFGVEGRDLVMVGSRLAGWATSHVATLPSFSTTGVGFGKWSDGGSGDGRLGLGGELLVSGLGLGMLGTWEM